METALTDSITFEQTTESRASQIRTEQIRVVYQNLPLLLGGSLVVIAGIVFGLWNEVPRTQLVVWACILSLLTFVRACLYWWNRRAEGDLSIRTWGMILTLGSGISGILWGILGGFLLPASSLEYQLFILFILVALGASAISSLSAHLPAFFAFFPISMLPIGIAMIAVNQPIHIALGVLSITYVAVLSFFARTTNKSLTESLTLRFENSDLVQELSLQRDEADRANIAKSKFLAAASHDLRQPLHSLTLFTAALDEQIERPKERGIVNNINASVEALEKLFDSLLDVSRLDAGVLQPEIRDFYLEDLLNRLITEFEPETNAKQLTLSGDSGDTVVRSDPMLLERVLRNYLSNAVRYTNEGSIAVSAVVLNEQVRIEVTDSGIGIPAVQHRQIFDEFHQLGNPERDRTKGLGLGLAIVDRVARLLGHSIDVNSVPGEGSCFSITVPLGNKSGVTHDDKVAEETAGISLAGKRVVVVDDEIGVREGMRTLMEQWGCEVAVAGSEDEAVEAMRMLTDIPEAAIVDYRLRDGRTGVEAVERLNRELGLEIPALIVTGDTAVDRLRQAEASGYQVAHKPLRPAMLSAFLRNTTRRPQTD